MAGIYRITCTRPDGGTTFYYGQARCLRKRRNSHWCDLRAGRHANPRLQSCWDKYGPDSFSFTTVIEMNRRAMDDLAQVFGDAPLDALENRYLSKWFSHPDCANMMSVARGTGSHSMDALRRIGEAQRGKDVSEETRRLQSDAKRISARDMIASSLRRGTNGVRGRCGLGRILINASRCKYRSRREVFSELRRMRDEGLVSLEPGQMKLGKRSVRVTLL